MKAKIFFTILVITCIYINVFSQIEKPIKKGNTFLAGNIGYSRTNKTNNKQLDIKSSLWEVSPTIGHFVINNLAVGFSIPYNKLDHTEKMEQYIEDPWRPTIPDAPVDENNGLIKLTQINKTKTTSYGLQPFARYFFNNGIFIEADLSYTNNNADVHIEGSSIFYPGTILPGETLTTETKYRTWGYSVKAGYVFFINQKVGIETSLKYHTQKTIDDIETVTTERNAQIYLISNNGEIEPQYNEATIYEYENRKTSGLMFNIGLIVFL